ncbi:MAG TPA: hypothetical protein VMI52_04400 [Acetobacteraceae bacterium]|nr:hypothetical protein [Acetobacteraceae bacterium]
MLALPQPDWLYHRLTVSGPEAALAAFRAAAAGAGVVPWVYDYDQLEEDWFHLLIAPPPHRRSISLHGARILARNLRDAAFERHEHAVSLVGFSSACPFDLHALVPVPRAILRLGPDHPDARLWLWQNWGTTWPLRHVRELKQRAGDEAGFVCEFWSADWTPWPALRQARTAWPTLRLNLKIL